MNPFAAKPWSLISRALLLAVLTLIAIPSIGFGQYSLKSSSLSTVGGKSSGGNYSVSSAIGTTGAGATASGGNYSVTSSPWSLAIVETPGAPKLGIAAASGTVRITWPSPSTGWVLQQNTNSVRSVNWSNVTATFQDDGTTKTLILNPPTGNRFYRLFKP